MVKQNLELCRKRLDDAAKAAGRATGDITLVAVSKGVSLPLIYEAIDCGITHIGESKIQEVLLKYDGVRAYANSKNLRINWHMVGHLQTNKVKEAVKIFDLIHSVDSVRLACAIDKQALKSAKVQDILLEVNAAKEEGKYGFFFEEVLPAFAEVEALKNIRVIGFMVVAPIVDKQDEAKPYFRKLKELRDSISKATGRELPILSMGMSDDFEAAVSEGATMVRIGRAIFGERSK